MFGNSEAKSAAQDIVEILLGRKPTEGYEEFFKQISRIGQGFSFSIDGIRGPPDTFSKENNQELNLKTNDMRMPPETFSKENNSSAYNQIASSDWSFKFLNKLGRNKKTVVKNLRRNIRRLDLYQETINDSVSKLETYRKKLKRYHLGISEARIAKKNLTRVARVVIGRERYGPGKYIYEHLQNLKLDIQSSQKNSKVPETVCQNIMHTLAQVYDPPLEKLDEILKFAKQYRNSCLKSLKNTETVNHNDGTESKKGTEKNWQASKLQEKNIAQNEDISEDMNATQKEKGNNLQLEKNVKKILLQKDNTRKTGKKTKKKETKNKKKQQCKLCKKITKQCSKCLKQKLLRDSGSNILHPHKQVDASQLKKVNKAETSKIGENKTMKSKGNKSRKLKVSKKVKERVIKNDNTKKIPDNC